MPGNILPGMKYWSIWAALLASLVIIAGCQKAHDAKPAVTRHWVPTHANPPLPTIQLWLGPAQITAEMALTEKEEMTGLMFRTNLAENAGMLFVFPTQRASFWMHNCSLPLSIAYIDPAGVIQEIHPLQPNNTNSVYSATNNIHYALETRQGWFKRHGVRPGMVVRTEQGSLRETFQQNR